MSEIQNRMALETDFARKLSKLSSLQRAEMRQIMGDPPDASKITDADWERWRQQRQQQIVTILLAIYLSAADQHVTELLGGQVPADQQHSDMVRRAITSTATQAAEVAQSGIDAAKEIVGMAGAGWKSLPPSKEAVEQVLTQALGPARDAATAATETTRAAVAGTNAVAPVVQAAGYNLVTRWNTERDDRVCPVCRPLHGKVPDLWEPVLSTLVAPGGSKAIASIMANGGPPAHPNCRCWLTTQAEPAAKRVRR